MDIGQKVKAKYQKAKGEMQMRRGDVISGTIEKVKGGVNDSVSDMKRTRGVTPNRRGRAW
jgi:hypothetical protein